jgi:hypothetical protein
MSPRLSPSPLPLLHEERERGGERSSGDPAPASVNDTESTNQHTPLPQRGRGVGGEGHPQRGSGAGGEGRPQRGSGAGGEGRPQRLAWSSPLASRAPATDVGTPAATTGRGLAAADG